MRRILHVLCLLALVLSSWTCSSSEKPKRTPVMKAFLKGMFWHAEKDRMRAYLVRVPTTGEFQLRVEGVSSTLLADNASYGLDFNVNAPSAFSAFPLGGYAASQAGDSQAGVRVNGIRQSSPFFGDAHFGYMELTQFRDYYVKGDLYVQGEFNFEATVPYADTARVRFEVPNGSFFVAVDTATADYRDWRKLNQ